MLSEIARIKKENLELILDPEELNDNVLNLFSMGFIRRSGIRFKEPVKVRLIKKPQSLREYARIIGSCLFRVSESDSTQDNAYQSFLSDPGALYFSIDSKDHLGYSRFYAGELLSGDYSQILFEDVLRSQERSVTNGSANYQQEFKAVNLMIMEQLDLLDDSYLVVPTPNKRCFGGEQLILTKLGSEKFKKGFLPQFYEGRWDDVYRTDWPSFESSRVLFE